MSNESDPVNIGNPHEVTMLELAREIIKITNSKSEIIFNALPEDDPKVRQPDITKAKTILNWLPVIQREEGLIKTMHYFKKAMSIT
jgi:dTDP-glucose 4,6-dehydratase